MFYMIMKRYILRTGLSLLSLMLLMSCGGPKLSLDDAVQSVKAQIIQDELIDRYIKRERRNLDDAVNDFFRRYAHNGVYYSVTTDNITESDCLSVIHDIVNNQNVGLNKAIELFEDNPNVFHYSYLSFLSVQDQNYEEELHAGGYDETYIGQLMNCLEDDFSADIFLDDLSVYFYGKVWEECCDYAERVTIESSEWKSGAWLIKTDSYGSFSVTKIDDEIIVTPKSIF